ncbi:MULTISPECIES: DUF397 domain-containing protein [Streptomyces]|uniref:DUF397 domain-containing protein n=1 Tax=Streptomyces luteosporeus TaxID=173856 RepID=A0ABN3TU11_9ACTN
MTDIRRTALGIAGEESWFKSSYSGENSGVGCVSIAVLPTRVGIRDSKVKNGPAVTVPRAAWAAFAAFVGGLRTRSTASSGTTSSRSGPGGGCPSRRS